MAFVIGVYLAYYKFTGSAIKLQIIIEVFRIYKIIPISQKTMQKHFLNNPNPAIFQPATEKTTAAIKDDSMCLQAVVFLDKHQTQEIRLTMTNFYLAICSPHIQYGEYLFAAELQFNLKFQVMFPQESKVQQQNPNLSKKLGIRLIKEGTSSIEFYFKSQPLLDIWLKYLSKNLNQYGFHKLYKPIKKLGSGGFANVYEVQRLTDKQRFAVKAFSKSATIHSQNPQNRLVLLNQIQMLRTFDNPNILKLEGVFESDNSIYIVLELFSNGQLHNKINETRANFTQNEVKQFLRGLAAGLSEIHSYRIMHRDIKPENIMLRGKTGLQPVIVDFGLAADVDSDEYIFYRCGTPGYVAPEIISYQKGEKLTTECDIFSAGCILHVLLVKRPLFEGNTAAEVYQSNKKCIFNLNSSFYKKVDPQAMDLLRRMLKINPKDRITAEEMLNHPYLSEGMEVEEQKCVISPATTATSRRDINFRDAEYEL